MEQITRKRESRKQIGKEDVDGAGKDDLIEKSPIRDISSREVPGILAKKSKRTEGSILLDYAPQPMTECKSTSELSFNL